ncbi:hypothetical protein BMW23_1047 [Bodo saltans virus]|jgi:hypothetical protein|uniref:Uncharacterized protein n=1 Tax=Bodo saltans virus TaxID=2024608 RepID=A0A2H4UVY8_9VIRU|nr:hypothetical protein QJ851_gp1028 [Bodo saltans virus]ATZ81091.1 hypothetical protein BMW23_1047 [Bodo saltans virus]
MFRLNSILKKTVATQYIATYNQKKEDILKLIGGTTLNKEYKKYREIYKDLEILLHAHGDTYREIMQKYDVKDHDELEKKCLNQYYYSLKICGLFNEIDEIDLIIRKLKIYDRGFAYLPTTVDNDIMLKVIEKFKCEHDINLLERKRYKEILCG